MVPASGITTYEVGVGTELVDQFPAVFQSVLMAPVHVFETKTVFAMLISKYPNVDGKYIRFTFDSSIHLSTILLFDLPLSSGVS